MSRLTRRGLIAAAPFVSMAARAQTAWQPTRTVTIIIPFAAGGATDVMGRLVAGPMGTRLGQTVVVENVAGGSGGIAAGRVARATPDGQVLLLGHIGVFALNPSLFNRLPYDPAADFTPVGLVATNPMVLLVSKQSGVTSIAALREKARTGRITIGSSGLGTTLHMGGVMLARAVGGQSELIPYRGGGPAINDLHAGVLDVVVDQALTAIPAIDGGARPLAVTGPVRLATLPDVPTTREAGLEALDLEVWNILAVPRATPAPITAALAEALSVALDDATVKARFATYSARPPQGDERGPAAAAALVRDEQAKWARFIREAGIEKEGA